MSKFNFAFDYKEVDTNIYLPILDSDKILLYRVDTDSKIVQKLTELKSKYSYDDVKIIENTLINPITKLPCAIEYGKDKLFAVKKCELIYYDNDRCDIYTKFGGSRYADAIMELSYYPKIYSVLNAVFDNSHIMDLKYLANYFLEYDNLDKFIKDERKVLRVHKDDLILNSKITTSEKMEGINEIITDISDLFSCVKFTPVKEIKVQDTKVLVDIDTTKEEMEKIKDYYYLGKSNKKSIEVLNGYFNKNVNLSKKNVKKV